MGWIVSRSRVLILIASAATLAAAAVKPIQLHYAVSWRLMHAGDIEYRIEPSAHGGQAILQLVSTGLVDSLYNVRDHYVAQFDEGYCATSYLYQLQQGDKQRQIAVTYNQPPGTASYIERDVKRDEVVNQREIDIPGCVHEELGGLALLRTEPLEPGESLEIPVSNGKKYASVKVEALNRAKVETPSGVYDTIRHEVFIYRDVIYRRKARMWVWLTDDERRLPVQIRVDLGFLLGTVTLKLENQEL